MKKTKQKKYPGIIIGKHPTKNIFLTSYGQTFVLLAASPGSGKGVSFIVPNLLSFPDSVAVNDPKFENWNITSGFRAACGHECYRFSPELLETHRWNPLSYLATDELDRFGDIKSLSSTLFVDPDGKNQSFYNNAGKICSAIILYLMETPELPLTLPQVYEITSLGDELPGWITDTIEARENANRPLSDETIRELMIVVAMSANEKSWGIYTDILSEILGVYGEKKVAWAVSGNDIDFSKMREKRMSVYFSVTEGAVEKFGTLMNLFFTQLMRANSKVLPEDGGVDENGEPILKYQIGMFMDETKVMGRIKAFENGPALLRGYGFRFNFIFQNKDQLRARNMYGTETANAMMNAFHIEIVYAPPKQDVKAAEEYSKSLGTTTVDVVNHSDNFGHKQRSRTKSRSKQSRPLMLPQEIQEMPYDEELIFVQGTRKSRPLNIKARKIFWYKEEVFTARANMPKPNIPLASPAQLSGLVVSMRKKEQAINADFNEDFSALINEEQNKRL
ncbi:TPA: type IV secretory system conjugative DNA transfer family protein [Salmonella enterica subsp. enterica serovar Agona]|nr:type IV secretory system conjugative DNA transfer family protein [Salmonella enterica subsp. enterica serovar Agona]HCM3461519.1 type IV secretory system conjugative DNA transfer family protein [Salmonella enterica subsp. enterica serovar Agona]